MAKQKLNFFDVGAMTLAGGTGIASMFLQSEGAEDEQTALDIEQTEAEEASTQRSIQRIERMRQIMANATAAEVSRGISVASPTFKAVQRSSFTRFNKDEDADALNLSFKEAQISSQRQLVRDKEEAGIFGSLTQGIEDIAFLAI